MEFETRLARDEDVPRIVEIARQIWEGHDYVPTVIWSWLGGDGEVLVAEGDGVLVAFAHWFWMVPGLAWFEGIRADPALQGRGAGKALTQSMVERVRAAGARRIALSTYIDNTASIRIIESQGFMRTASYVYLDASHDSALAVRPAVSPDVVEVPVQEAVAYIARSRWLSAAHGYLSAGWKFYPFGLAAEKVLARLPYLLGIRDGAGLSGLLGSSGNSREPNIFAIDFLDGTPEAMRTLLAHALTLPPPVMEIEISVPERAPALAVLRAAGFRSWHNDEADVWVYQRDLETEGQIGEAGA